MGKRALALLLGLLAAIPAAAGEPAPGLRAFRAGRVATLDGPPVAPGLLLVRGPLVEKVLPGDGPVPEGAEVIDLGGGLVFPGLIDPLSQLPAAANYRDARPGALSSGPGQPGDTRGLRAADGIRPQSPVLRRLGRSGYAALAVTPPGAGFLSGLAAVVRPRAAETREKTLVKEVAYLSMSYGLGQPMRELAEKELSRAAQAHKKAKEEREKAQKAKDEKPAEGAKPKEAPPPPDPLVQVFAGELTALVRVDSAAALDHFLRLVDGLPEPFPFVLATPPLEAAVVEKLERRKALIRGVILDTRLSVIPDTSVHYNCARLFHEAGMELSLVPSTDDLTGHREMLFGLAELVKGGLPEEVALKAVTASPARLLGIADRLGSLAAGREASFLVLDGDPLSGRTSLLRVYLEGEEVYRDDPSSGRTEGEALR